MGGSTAFVAKARALAASRWGQRTLKALRAAFIIGVIAWLVYRLSGIGWLEVWEARPRTPWFYVIWLVLYVQLPIIESLIYRSLWGLRFWEGLPPIVRKRVLNQDVVSYSGEAYFFAWVRQRLSLSDWQIAGTLKDNAIASSLSNWTAALLLISACIFADQIVLVDLLGDRASIYVAAGAAVAVGLVALIVQFRKTLFTLSPRTVLGLYGTYLARFVLIGYAFQILQWWVVLPEAPFSVWATMLAVLTFINRLPLIPAKDLVGIGAILGMTELLAASASTIAAMLLVRSALDKLTNLLLFGGTLLLEKYQPQPLPEPQPDLHDAVERSG